jgi:hypothetical protein
MPSATPRGTWVGVVNYLSQEIDRQYLASISADGDPAMFNRLTELVESRLAPEIAKAGECYAGSIFELNVKSLHEGVERYRPTLEASSRWEKRETARLEDEHRAAQRQKEFEAFRSTGGTKEVLGQYRISILEASTHALKITKIRFRLENISEGHIIRPTTSVAWGYDANSPNLGGRAPIGFRLMDDFGNELPLKDIDKKLGPLDAGLQPRLSEDFGAVFSGVPPEKARVIKLIVAPNILGNKTAVIFRIPRDILTDAVHP